MIRSLLVIALALLGCCKSQVAAQGIAITHVNVFDGRSAELKKDVIVIIRGDRIVQVGDSKSIHIPRGFHVIVGEGQYVIPGLWDMHVHLAGLSADPKWSGDLFLPRLVDAGILGIRDMGGDPVALNRWKQEIAGGSRIGPFIVAAGKMIDDAFEDPSVITVHGPEESRKAVDEIARAKSDFVKVLSDLTRDEYFEVAKESRAQHLKLVGHLTPAVSVDEALDAGQHSFEHIIYSGLPLACTNQEQQLEREMSDALKSGAIRQIGAVLDRAAAAYDSKAAQALWTSLKQRDAAVVPTLVSTYVNAHMDELSKDTAELAGIPQDLQQQWSSAVIMRRYQPDKLAFYKRELEREQRLVHEMYLAGVRVLPGSDSLDPHNLPGSSLHKELELLVESGLTPAQVLMAATSQSTDFLGLGDRGSISPGQVADIVFLSANPLEDIGNTRKVVAVFTHGRYQPIPLRTSN